MRMSLNGSPTCVCVSTSHSFSVPPFERNATRRPSELHETHCKSPVEPSNGGPDLVPCLRIPHSHCSVTRCGTHPRPILTDRNCIHPTRMPPDFFPSIPSGDLHSKFERCHYTTRTRICPHRQRMIHCLSRRLFSGRHRRMLQIQRPTLEWCHPMNPMQSFCHQD